MDVRSFITFMGVMERLKDNTRHSWTSGGRHESVAEHSWRLALMAYFMKDEFPDIDMDKVIRMCLIHDMGEAVTGDIPTFEKTEDHRTAERMALNKLLDTLPEPWPVELKTLFDEMEALETEEAKLYKSLDRMEAILQHNEADISTWIPLEYDLNLVYGMKEAAFSPYTLALRKAMAEDTQKMIDDEKNGGAR
jgi:putative hydrolase of HD superfamily